MLAVLVLLAQSLSVDIHAHPSRVHRANVSRIEAEEIARYRRSGIDVVHRGVRRRGALRRDAEALHGSGYSPGDIEKVMGENFVRVWREVTR